MPLVPGPPGVWRAANVVNNMLPLLWLIKIYIKHNCRLKQGTHCHLMQLEERDRKSPSVVHPWGVHIEVDITRPKTGASGHRGHQWIDA